MDGIQNVVKGGDKDSTFIVHKHSSSNNIMEKLAAILEGKDRNSNRQNVIERIFDQIHLFLFERSSCCRVVMLELCSKEFRKSYRRDTSWKVIIHRLEKNDCKGRLLVGVTGTFGSFRGFSLQTGQLHERRFRINGGETLQGGYRHTFLGKPAFKKVSDYVPGNCIIRLIHRPISDRSQSFKNKVRTKVIPTIRKIANVAYTTANY